MRHRSPRQRRAAIPWQASFDAATGPVDTHAAAKMDGFDALPPAFRDLFNYGPQSMEEPHAFALLGNVLRAEPHRAATLYQRATQAINATNVEWTDRRKTNR